MSQSWARAAILTLKRLQHTKVQLAEQFASTLNPARAWRTVLQSGSQLIKVMVRSAQLPVLKWKCNAEAGGVVSCCKVASSA